MEPRVDDKVKALLNKGVCMPAPWTVYIAPEVTTDNIAEKGVVIHPGCRIRGSRTVISEGCQLGAEGPVTLHDCMLGRNVRLKGGFFKGSVFLDRSSTGASCHVREACLLEEEASVAHAVGLKQTILFPFVTLGSLINFCDILMAGGTSRKDHSEVGSSYIHFNFTPNGDKATASLVGDVPRGVMLDMPRIFLGGQGGLVGPARIEYGVVVAAGHVQRGDVTELNRLVVPRTPKSGSLPFVAGSYPGWRRILENNVEYIANLHALLQWYRYVRSRYMPGANELGGMILEGAEGVIQAAVKERVKRLDAFMDKMEKGDGGVRKTLKDRKELVLSAASDLDGADRAAEAERDGFLASLPERGDYLDVVKSLDPETRESGTAWLNKVVEHVRSACLASAGVV